MTFDEFEQACMGVKNSGTAAHLPCPVAVGDGQIEASISNTIDHQIVIFKLKTDNAKLSAIYSSVRFTYDAVNNETVITPKTTGT